MAELVGYIIGVIIVIYLVIKALPFILVIGGITGAIWGVNYLIQKEEENRMKLEIAERKRKEQEIEKRKQRELVRRRKQDEFIDEVTKELKEIEKEIQHISQKLKITFLINYHETVLRFVNKHRQEDLQSNRQLATLINEQTQYAEDVRQHLREAYTLYCEVSDFYIEVSRRVNRIGSIPLFKVLEELDKYLHCSNLKSLLSQKNWTDFLGFVHDIKDDLEHLKQVAIKYQWGDYKDYKSDEEPQDSNKMSEKKAYQILGVSADIQRDQLKRVWKKLAEIFHPDSGYAPNEARMKEINEAYQYLQKIRGFK